jgi:hypothetical protein
MLQVVWVSSTGKPKASMPPRRFGGSNHGGGDAKCENMVIENRKSASQCSTAARAADRDV